MTRPRQSNNNARSRDEALLLSLQLWEHDDDEARGTVRMTRGMEWH